MNPINRANAIPRLFVVCTVAFAGAVCLAQPAGNIPSPPGDTRPAHLRTPRIAPTIPSAWDEDQRQVIAKYRSPNVVGNGFATLLRIPALIDGIIPFHDYVTRDTSLPTRQRELLILRTAWLLNNHNLWAEHAAVARAAGFTPGAIRDIAAGAEAAGWTAPERSLLSLADELFGNSSVSDKTWRALSTDLDTFGLLDAVMTVAEFTSLGLIYNALGVQPDDQSADQPLLDVPYRVSSAVREPALREPRVEPIAGSGLAIGRTFARYPRMATPRSTGSNYVNGRSTLPPRFREMLILRTGWNCQSEYEWAQHVGRVGRGREMGLPIERIAAGPEADGWTAVEQNLLRAADELYSHSTITDGTWSRLASHFDTTSLINIVVTAANYRMVSMALNALGVQLDPGDEGFPK